MLKSLFGELVPTPLKPGGVMPEFAATAVLETTDTRVTDDGRMLDRHQQDLFVSGSPAAAMRAHLASAKHVAEVKTITLLDPARLWAPGVIKALSDATGQPVERLHLREQATLRILATLERTIVPRRGDATLAVNCSRGRSVAASCQSTRFRACSSKRLRWLFVICVARSAMGESTKIERSRSLPCRARQCR